MTENLELREWIAVNVMGLEQVQRGWLRVEQRGMIAEDSIVPGGNGPMLIYKGELSWLTIPPYELTWNDAALVVEAMAERGYTWQGNATPGQQRFRFFRDCDVSGVTQFARDSVDGSLYQFADSVPLAICLAAKAAIEGAQ